MDSEEICFAVISSLLAASSSFFVITPALSILERTDFRLEVAAFSLATGFTLFGLLDIPTSNAACAGVTSSGLQLK